MFRVDPGFLIPNIPTGYALALIAIPNPSTNPKPSPSPDRSYMDSDEFKMYEFKVKRCPNKRAHDWTQCPWAHPGERARRRDPRRVGYVAVPCSEFRAHQRCQRGDRCEFAHGVFEYWLHPARYRTRACTSGANCTRKVCFFAHNASQLRPETRYRFVSSDEGSTTAVVKAKELKMDVLEGMRKLSTHDDHDETEGSSWGSNFMEYECVDEMPDVEWISDLIGWETEKTI